MKNAFFSSGWQEGTHSLSLLSWRGNENEVESRGSQHGLACALAIPRHYMSVFEGFSHDVTKIQTKKLSILPRFYFHDALEQLKTNFLTNVPFKKGSWFCDRGRLNF